MPARGGIKRFSLAKPQSSPRTAKLTADLPCRYVSKSCPVVACYLAKKEASIAKGGNSTFTTKDTKSTKKDILGRRFARTKCDEASAKANKCRFLAKAISLHLQLKDAYVGWIKPTKEVNPPQYTFPRPISELLTPANFKCNVRSLEYQFKLGSREDIIRIVHDIT